MGILQQDCLAELGPPPLDALLDTDVSSLLGIQKWLPMRQRPADSSTEALGNEFPTFLIATNQPRIQNLWKNLAVWTSPEQSISWEITEKLDGTSLTIFTHNGDEGICSRSWRVSLETREGELATNIYSKITERENLLGKLRSLNRNIAAQGELVGPEIQGNKYNLTETAFFCFDLFDIDLGQYIDPVTRRQLCEQIGMTHIPVVAQDRLTLPIDTYIHTYIHTYK